MSRKVSVVLALSLTLVAGGCSDKDREMVTRKADGTESFKFDAKAVPVPSPPKPVAKPAPVPGSSVDTFKFDPKAVPGAVPSQTGKAQVK